MKAARITAWLDAASLIESNKISKNQVLNQGKRGNTKFYKRQRCLILLEFALVRLFYGGLMEYEI